MKNLLFFIAIFAIMLSPVALRAQHLFSVSQNDLSKENVIQLKNQIAQSEISTLSLTRNNEDRNVYSVSLSSVENTRIIILNEQTENHVVLIPVEESCTEFQLAPFFIEELKQGALGNASQYLIVEATADFSVRNISSVPVSNEEVFIPRYLYGKKEDVKEALPKDRQIMHIFKEKPQLILANPVNSELLNFAAQWEEERSYYVYMYKLPDGGLWIYDEHFNKDNDENEIKIRGQLQFTLSGNLNAQQQEATYYALNLWSEKLSGTVPLDINITYVNLGGGGIIGQSWRTPNYWDPETQSWYCSALGNQMAGYNVVPGQRDIRLEMNTQMPFNYNQTSCPYGQMDWITIMLHEVTHGLGFYALVGSNGAYSYTTPSGGSGNTNYPGIYDRQLFQGLTGSCLTDLSQTERASLVKSNNLYSGAPGSYLLEANSGNRVKMYAPSSYSGGSSVSHWDESVTFSTFMKAFASYGFRLHTIGTRKIGILRDLGWKEDDPDAIYVTFNSNGGEGNMQAQQFSSGVAQNLKENTFTRTGYTFNNWNTQLNGTGTTYQDKETITISANLDLYAQWQAHTYTLTFNPGNGTVDITSKQVTFDAPVGELPVPVRPGYTFQGWRIDATNIDEEFIWDYTQNKTASANWAMTTHTITATATSGGKISSLGSILVPEGKNKTYTITPNQDYWILDVLVDDESVGAVPEYTFENVTASHTIHAVFTNVGINETEYKAIQIIPNPTTGQFTIINFNEQINHVEIFDVYGKKLSSHHLILTSSNPHINISHLQAGVYFVKIETENGAVTKKVIKN